MIRAMKQLLIFMVSVIMFASIDSHSLNIQNENVDMQLYVIIANSEGVLLDGLKTLDIQLIGDEYGISVLWEKQFEDILITNGVLDLEIEGSDDYGNIMNIRMFDEYNIKVKITIDDEEMNLKLITQPYVIKSRISDLSYSIDMLNGIPIRNVSEESLEDGSILMIKNNEWVPVQIKENFKESINEFFDSLYLEDVVSVNIKGVRNNQILRLTNDNWENNFEDIERRNSEIINIVSNNGYKTEMGPTEIPFNTLYWVGH